MRRSRGAILLVLAACAPDVRDPHDSLSASAGIMTTAPPPPKNDPPEPGTSDDSSWLSEHDWPKDQCDIFAQDCPEGQKCMPSDSYSVTVCTPIMPNPGGLYDPCVHLGDGWDTCGMHLMCWNRGPNGDGECWGQCIGSETDPECEDPEAWCSFGRSALSLCTPPGCHPLMPDCDADQVCVWNPMDPTSFLCVPDVSGEEGQAFDPCEYLNSCDPGLLCVNPALAAECDPLAPGCCLPFCDLSAPICPRQDHECLPWYEDGQAPPGHENVGVCGLPQ